MSGIHGLLRASTDRNPSQPVFVRQERTSTYEELEHRSSQFAAALRELGIQRGDRVAVVLDGDIDFLIAYYGVAKVGAAVVPVCPDTRTGPLVHALGHSGASAVILDAGNVKYLSGQAENLPNLRQVIARGATEGCEGFACTSFASLVEHNDELADIGVSDNDLLSVTYTSGTTGRPKGVMLSHRNLVANVRSIVEYLELRATDRVAMVLPFYYVYGNSVLHTHIGAGATIVHAGSMTFPAGVLKTVQTQRCTGLSGVPATFTRLLGVRNLSEYDVSSLRYITQAGAAMTPALTARLHAAFKGASIFVMYGQTEASARLSYLPPKDLERKLGSAGKAIPGVSLHIVDSEGHELPPGETGEVVARGDNVMLGYWNDPVETARVLRADGLHTGDLGSMDEEGFLFIVGRESEMIKSGAHRISPKEIENAVSQAPGVLDVVVAGVPDELMGQSIAAFIIPQPGQPIEKQLVMRTCLMELPRFKLPEHLLVVAEFPRTANGKVSRKALVNDFIEKRVTALQ